jgi:hypothetical protein
MKVAKVKGDADEKMCNNDKSLLDMDCSVSNGVHPRVMSMIDPLPEGRVHGGGLLALLSQVADAQVQASQNTTAWM